MQYDEHNTSDVFSDTPWLNRTCFSAALDLVPEEAPLLSVVKSLTTFCFVRLCKREITVRQLGIYMYIYIHIHINTYIFGERKAEKLIEYSNYSESGLGIKGDFTKSLVFPSKYHFVTILCQNSV